MITATSFVRIAIVFLMEFRVFVGARRAVPSCLDSQLSAALSAEDYSSAPSGSGARARAKSALPRLIQSSLDPGTSSLSDTVELSSFFDGRTYDERRICSEILHVAFRNHDDIFRYSQAEQ
jgi:hypothetical protein